MSKMIEFLPGTKSANTNIDLPSGAPKVASILRAEDIDTGAYTAAADVAPATLTVVTTTPGAGQIQLIDENTIQLGDATTGNTSIRLLVVEIGELGPQA